MSPSDPNDVHAPYVRELAEAGDWAGLVRYWLAHQHEPVLELAIALLQFPILFQVYKDFPGVTQQKPSRFSISHHPSRFWRFSPARPHR